MSSRLHYMYFKSGAESLQSSPAGKTTWPLLCSSFCVCRETNLLSACQFPVHIHSPYSFTTNASDISASHWRLAGLRQNEYELKDIRLTQRYQSFLFAVKTELIFTVHTLLQLGQIANSANKCLHCRVILLAVDMRWSTLLTFLQSNTHTKWTFGCIRDINRKCLFMPCVPGIKGKTY